MMKKKKYLSRPYWILPFLMLAVIVFSWLSDQLLGGDTVMMVKVGAYLAATGASLIYGAYWLSKGVRIEQQLKKHMLCIYCVYILDDHVWPQQCPECGEHLTRDEVIAYWERHADIDWFIDLSSSS